MLAYLRKIQSQRGSLSISVRLEKHLLSSGLIAELEEIGIVPTLEIPNPFDVELDGEVVGFCGAVVL